MVEELKEEIQETKANPVKTNNRMPGNIVCGICGAVRYYAFILQAKKFGTFSCEPCRKFISKTIKMCESNQDQENNDELFPCLSATGEYFDFKRGLALRSRVLVLGSKTEAEQNLEIAFRLLIDT